VREHPFPMLDFAAAQASRIGPIEARGVSFQPDFFLTGCTFVTGCTLLPDCASDEANDHETDSIARA